jgi:GNAT superfamily N-acetyltransferase
MNDTEIRIRALGAPGDLGWVVMAHGEIYAQEFGWNAEFEALVAQIVADYANDPDPAGRGAWIAELDGRRAGCIFCVRDSEQAVAKVRILLVHPDARRRGLGDRLLETALQFAAAAGYEHARLWTNDPLIAARRIYLRHGFKLTTEEPHHSFGVDLIGQTYELDLRNPQQTRDETTTAGSLCRIADRARNSSAND